MKNIFIKAISAGLFALVAIVPAFAHADAPGTGDSSTSGSQGPSTGDSSTSSAVSAPSTGDSATSASNSSAPSTGDSATSAGTTNAPSTGDSATSASSGTAPSTGDSATSAGSTSSNGGSSNGGSSNGGSSGGSSRSRGGGSARISLTNVQIEKVSTGLKVSWESNPKTQGRVVYGANSVSTLVTSDANYGYTGSTALTESQAVHSAIVPARAGSVIYIRIVGQNDNRVEFGSEIAVTIPTSQVSPDSSVTAPGQGATETDGNLELDLTKKKESRTVAASAESSIAQKIGGFFKWIWMAIVGIFR